MKIYPHPGGVWIRAITPEQSKLLKSGKINMKKGRVPPRTVCAMKNTSLFAQSLAA